MDVFTDDAVAVQALSKLADTDAGTTARRASAYVATADNATAFQAIRDAERALNQTEGEMDNQGLRRSAEAHVANANRQFDRAQRVLARANDSDGRRAVRQRAQAIRAMRTAWQQAHQGLKLLDRDIPPSVEIVDRPDPVRNGSTPANRTVAVQVNDIRPWTLETISVSLDGQQQSRLPTESVSSNLIDSDPVALPVRLDSAVTNITVTVTDDDGTTASATRQLGGKRDDDGDGIPTETEIEDGRKYGHDVDFDGVPNWKDSDADGDGIPDGEEGTGDADGDGMPNYLDNDRDNDGLPDSYELNVTGTDPADNDSDTDRISYDAADNDIIDGMEDFDADTLGNYREYTLGTDPFDNDTDGDGLSDGFESRHHQFDPTDPDTDGDGVQDGAADLDGDDLSNAAEDRHGTLVAVNDTDRDDIPDGAEIANGTDPTAGDTDSDGLADATELELGTDPTDPDSDDDGVLDGNETFTTTATASTVDATVTVNGSGTIDSAVTVEQETTEALRSAPVENYSVSPVVHLQSTEPFENATVELGYNESRVDEATDTLAVARYNRSTQQIELLDSNVDTANDTLTTTTSHFSYYWIVDVNRFETQFDQLTPDRSSVLLEEDFDGPAPEWTCRNDGRSGGADDTPTKGSCTIENSNATIIEETNRMRYFERTVSIPADAENVTFRTDIWGQVRSSWAQSTVELVIEGEGTSVTAYKLRNRYSSATRSESKQVEVNVSEFAGQDITISYRVDGRYTYQSEDTRSAIKVDSVSVFQSGASTSVDSDGDGLSDRLERNLQVWSGETLQTDPTDPDTDGDGLTDGEEIGGPTSKRQTIDVGDRSVSVSIQHYTMDSNPLEVDSDGDGLSDKTEREGWETTVATSAAQGDRYRAATQDTSRDASEELTTITVSSDPRNPDTDDDRVDDFTEYRNGMDPASSDTDGDTIPDKEELRQNQDPVIHDHTPPTVNPQSISANGVRTNYTLTVSITDASGFERVAFRKKDSVQHVIVGDGTEAETYHDREFTVERGGFDKIVTGISGFARPVTVDARAIDIHDNENRQTIKGPDSFGQAARVYDRAPVDVGEEGFVGLASFSSGVTTAGGETVVGIVELVKDPIGYAEEMKEFVVLLAKNPAIVGKLPKLMADSIREQHQTRNPFDRGDEYYDTFGGSWSLGYSTATVAPAFATRGGSLSAQALSKSRRLQQLVSAVDSAVPSRVPNGVRPGILVQAGKIDDTLPDVDVQTGRLSARLSELPGPKRQSVTGLFDQLDGDTKRYLGEADIEAPASKSADLFANTGTAGRQALDELAERDPDAADALLAVEDAATQRRFVQAYEGDQIDSDELTGVLKEYDELDPNKKQTADAMLDRGGDDAVSLLDETACYNPCPDFTETWHDLKQADAVNAFDATTFRNNLLGAKQRGVIGDEQAARLLGDAMELANEDGIDVTDVINRGDIFSRTLLRKYAESDAVGPDTLRKLHLTGKVDLPAAQIDKKYKHADDFGITGNKNPENMEKFKQAIAEHAVNPATERIEGGFTRLSGDTSVTHLYNPNTGNNVIVDDGEFLTAFKLNPGQRTNIENDGVIGGS